ncbi:MAG: DUF1722 domain-containing protein [Gammaproteobacteria bacterium]|nr:DUF1722 domain-containing protein [Gammaproteobacteria bacterium]MCW8987196.1 DUF1722 domain-containing protein [Gammaproteobacteria bacterium]
MRIWDLNPGYLNRQSLLGEHRVMARDIAAYKDIGKWVTSKSGSKDMRNVSLELTSILRLAPDPGLIENTLLHMWGYVSKYDTLSGKDLGSLSMPSLLKKIQKLSLANNVTYLNESTSLSELDSWKL